MSEDGAEVMLKKVMQDGVGRLSNLDRLFATIKSRRSIAWCPLTGSIGLPYTEPNGSVSE